MPFSAQFLSCAQTWLNSSLFGCWIILNQQSKLKRSLSLSPGARQLGTQWTLPVCCKQEPTEPAQAPAAAQSILKRTHTDTFRDKSASIGSTLAQRCTTCTHTVNASQGHEEENKTQQYTWTESPSFTYTHALHASLEYNSGVLWQR